MRVIPVPMLSDNYSYLYDHHKLTHTLSFGQLHHVFRSRAQPNLVLHRLVDNNGITAAVDPVEPTKAIEAAKKENLQISKVLTTHHHWYSLDKL